MASAPMGEVHSGQRLELCLDALGSPESMAAIAGREGLYGPVALRDYAVRRYFTQDQMADMLEPAGDLFAVFAPTLVETMSGATRQIYGDTADEVRIKFEVAYGPADDEPAFEFVYQGCELVAMAMVDGYEVLEASYRLPASGQALKVETFSAEALDDGVYSDAPAHEAQWLNALGPRQEEIFYFLASVRQLA